MDRTQKRFVTNHKTFSTPGSGRSLPLLIMDTLRFISFRTTCVNTNLFTGPKLALCL